MLIWDRCPRKIIEVLLSSTAHKFYTSEIADQSTLAYSTVYLTLQRLAEADVLIREQESFPFESPFREARVYYSINPEVFDYLKL